MSVKTISAQEFQQVVSSGNYTLVDVRTPVEFREVHVEGAVNVPLDRLHQANVPQPAADQPLYVICHKGSRGAQACQQLATAGFANVVNVDGGTHACQNAGLPVIYGQKAMSLERQVRIAAGSLVMLGVALGFTVHPAFYVLSAFVGAGLVFAGVTDTCGMGMLLARMPWNQVSDAACSTSPTSKAAA